VPDERLAKSAQAPAPAATTFAEIVDALVGDFDVIDVLTLLTTRCVELLAAGAAGILIADSYGRLRVVGASTEAVQLLELFQLQNDEGPCLDCYRTGELVLHSDLDVNSPWPRFAAECTAAGFASVCAVPLRLKSQTLGCLNMFMTAPHGLTSNDVALAQAMADFASIALVQDQATRDIALREGHLQHALTSRIAIEQAKGMIAERYDLDMEEAFERLRTYARNNNRRLTDVAEAIVASSLALDTIKPTRQPPPRPPAPA
jgi:GAF domain-containing protein